MDGRGWTARLYLADDPEAVLDLEHAAQHQVAVAAHLRRPRAGARGAAAPRRSWSQYDRIQACFSSCWNVSDAKGTLPPKVEIRMPVE